MMEQLVMMLVLSVVQLCWYAATALACAFMGSIGWHLGKRLPRG